MTNDKFIRVKECPFCGEKAEVKKTIANIYLVKCKNERCGAVVRFDNDLTNERPQTTVLFWNERRG